MNPLDEMSREDLYDRLINAEARAEELSSRLEKIRKACNKSLKPLWPRGQQSDGDVVFHDEDGEPIPWHHT